MALKLAFLRKRNLTYKQLKCSFFFLFFFSYFGASFSFLPFFEKVCFLNKSTRDSLANFSAYNARFQMPSKATQGNTNMWYSFDAGLVHFVSLDLETAYPGAAEENRYKLPLKKNEKVEDAYTTYILLTSSLLFLHV